MSGNSAWTAKKDAFVAVDAVLAKYREAPAVRSKVVKTISNDLLGSGGESKGEFFFSKGKLRLEFTEPEKNTVVYDGKYIWMESWMDAKSAQVTKIRTVDLKRSNSVLTALFGKKDVLRGFKLKDAKTKGDTKTYAFVPKDKNGQDEITALTITLKGKDLEALSYRDSVENEVKFDFADLKSGDVPAAKFTYKPPKNAQVTEI